MKSKDWLSIFALLLFFACALVYLLRFHVAWLNTNQNAIQAVSAIGTLFLTAILAIATWRYVSLTHELAAVSRQQFEAQRRPLLELDLYHAQPYAAMLKLINVGQVAIVVTGLLIKEVAEGPPLSFTLYEAVRAADDRSINIAGHLVQVVGVPAVQNQITQRLFIGVEYRTPDYIGMRGYMEYEVTVIAGQHGGYVNALKPVRKMPLL